MTPHQPQTNSGSVTVTINRPLKESIEDYIAQWGWNNEERRERQMKRTELTCKTVKG